MPLIRKRDWSAFSRRRVEHEARAALEQAFPLRDMHPVFAAVTAAYNRVIPKCAIQTRVTPTHIEYLHPTRGWKKVSYQRLGMERPKDGPEHV